MRLPDLRMALDPACFAQACGIEPDEWQTRLLRSDARRVLLNVHRQGGKSTTAGVIALHAALYQPGSLTLIVARAQRQSSELFRKVLGIYRQLGRPVPAESENQLSLELENGSRVIALPGKDESIRSFSAVALLLIDEAARVPDDLLAGVRPMLAVSQGRLIALSTPWGRRGWWYEAWVGSSETGSEAWERYEVKATDCPRIPASFLLDEERALGPTRFQSEYLCTFVDPEGSLFNMTDVRATLEEYPTWNLSKYLKPKPVIPTTPPA
jgi:Terminase large subunit, T4likevirus-type, N-terminal